MNNKKIISILLFLIIAFTPTITLARGAHPVAVPHTTKYYRVVVYDENNNVIYTKYDDELKTPDELDKDISNINFEEEKHLQKIFTIYFVTLLILISFIFYLTVRINSKPKNITNFN